MCPLRSRYSHDGTSWSMHPPSKECFPMPWISLRCFFEINSQGGTRAFAAFAILCSTSLHCLNYLPVCIWLPHMHHLQRRYDATTDVGVLKLCCVSNAFPVSTPRAFIAISSYPHEPLICISSWWWKLRQSQYLPPLRLRWLCQALWTLRICWTITKGFVLYSCICCLWYYAASSASSAPVS